MTLKKKELLSTLIKFVRKEDIMELHLGKMTLKELSEWFGLKPNSIAKSSDAARNKKLEILKCYADYHWQDGKLFIDEIYFPVYNKLPEVIEKEFQKRWGNVPNKDGTINSFTKKERIDTVTRVGTEIWENVPQAQAQVSLSTSINYTQKEKVRQYGRGNRPEHGLRGRSEYVWMKRDGVTPLNEEQMKIIHECAQLAYGNVGKMISVIDEDYHSGFLTKKERDQEVGNIDTSSNFDRYKFLVETRLGFWPERKTKLIDETNWE